MLDYANHRILGQTNRLRNRMRSQEAKRLRQRIAPSQSPAPWGAFQPPLDVRVQVRVEPASTKRGDCDWEIIYVYKYI